MVQTILAIVCAAIGSVGFWTFVTKLFDKKSAKSKMILGLAHHAIRHDAMEYIKQGHISQNDYEDLRKYLYEPYKAMGGDGSIERLMNEVDKLKIVD